MYRPGAAPCSTRRSMAAIVKDAVFKTIDALQLDHRKVTVGLDTAMYLYELPRYESFSVVILNAHVSQRPMVQNVMKFRGHADPISDTLYLTPGLTGLSHNVIITFVNACPDAIWTFRTGTMKGLYIPMPDAMAKHLDSVDPSGELNRRYGSHILDMAMSLSSPVIATKKEEHTMAHNFPADATDATETPVVRKSFAPRHLFNLFVNLFDEKAIKQWKDIASSRLNYYEAEMGDYKYQVTIPRPTADQIKEMISDWKFAEVSTFIGLVVEAYGKSGYDEKLSAEGQPFLFVLFYALIDLLHSQSPETVQDLPVWFVKQYDV